jgi:hypothetical protein
MRRLGFTVGIVAALAVALYADGRIQRWRKAEEEKRIHGTQILTGDELAPERRFPVPYPSAPHGSERGDG